jgi:putative transposase
MVRNIAEEYDFGIVEMEIDKDHIHLLVEYNPAQSVLELVRLIKQITTYRIWRQNDNYKYLSKQFWIEKTFWSDGYFACSIGQVSKDIIEKYIQTQG